MYNSPMRTEYYVVLIDIMRTVRYTLIVGLREWRTRHQQQRSPGYQHFDNLIIQLNGKDVKMYERKKYDRVNCPICRADFTIPQVEHNTDICPICHTKGVLEDIDLDIEITDYE